MSTNKNIPATPATLAQVDELITAQSESAIQLEETLAEKIVRLESQLAEAQQGNLKRPIEQPDGTTRTFEEVKAENRRLMEQWALEVESSRRVREEVERRNPTSYVDHNGQLAYRPHGFSERPLMSEDDAVKEFGLAK